MLVNRVQKNRKRLLPWAKKEGLTCYRLYDRDIPELPLAVDWYDGRLHIALFEGQKMSEAVAWVQHLGAALGAALGVSRGEVYIKFRRRAKGGTQYRPLGAAGHLVPVREAGLTFLVNLSDYIDTGLFLDHRILRRMVMQAAKDKRVLNLFSYTGAFSVYAAAGGARSTVTVDLSNTYIDWAARNMRENGFEGEHHHFVRDDILDAMESGRVSGAYDIAVMDPPTVSKSKAMRRDLDIERDHPLLINAVLSRLVPGGVLFFSNNLKKFKLRGDEIDCDDIENISERTRPFDFRCPFVHHSFRLKKRG